MEYTKLENINPLEVNHYRGNTLYTTIYMNSGEVLYVKEDFDTVDNYVDR